MLSNCWASSFDPESYYWNELISQRNCCLATQLGLTPCDPMDCSTPGFPSFTISRSLLRLMSIESVMPSNHLILCHPLLLPSVFPSIRAFSSESILHIRWPKYWSFPFGLTSSISLQSKCKREKTETEIVIFIHGLTKHLLTTYHVTGV